MVNRKRIEKALEKHAEPFLAFLESVQVPDFRTQPIQAYAPFAEALTALALYKSSKRLEQLSLALVILTVILAFLTIELLLKR